VAGSDQSFFGALPIHLLHCKNELTQRISKLLSSAACIAAMALRFAALQ
jgi:hypothetical protein